MPPTDQQLWTFLPWGYALTVALELPVLLVGLSPRHPLRRRIFAGFWLTACTYPIVILVLPPLLWSRWGETAYLIIAETFAPAAECLLFWLLFCRTSLCAGLPTPHRDQTEGLRRSTESGDLWSEPRRGQETRAEQWDSFTPGTLRDMAAIVAANLVSFLVGGWIAAKLFT
jgi:hypothetical protein